MSPENDEDFGEIQILPYNSGEEIDAEITPYYPDDDAIVVPLSEGDEYGDGSDTDVVEV